MEEWKHVKIIPTQISWYEKFLRVKIIPFREHFIPLHSSIGKESNEMNGKKDWAA